MITSVRGLITLRGNNLYRHRNGYTFARMETMAGWIERHMEDIDHVGVSFFVRGYGFRMSGHEFLDHYQQYAGDLEKWVILRNSFIFQQIPDILPRRMT